MAHSKCTISFKTTLRKQPYGLFKGPGIYVRKGNRKKNPYETETETCILCEHMSCGNISFDYSNKNKKTGDAIIRFHIFIKQVPWPNAYMTILWRFYFTLTS